MIHLACSVISMPSTSDLGLAGFLNSGDLLSLPGGDTKACRSSLWVALVRSGSSDVIG